MDTHASAEDMAQGVVLTLGGPTTDVDTLHEAHTHLAARSITLLKHTEKIDGIV